MSLWVEHDAVKFQWGEHWGREECQGLTLLDTPDPGLGQTQGSQGELRRGRSLGWVGGCGGAPTPPAGLPKRAPVCPALGAANTQLWSTGKDVRSLVLPGALAEPSLAAR